jgi:hypothetical protein
MQVSHVILFHIKFQQLSQQPCWTTFYLYPLSEVSGPLHG